jgi:hypothetical protein
MRKYTFRFLNFGGQVIQEQVLRAANDQEAMEFARLLDNPFAIRVCAIDHEVGTVLRGYKRMRTDFYADARP